MREGGSVVDDEEEERGRLGREAKEKERGRLGRLGRREGESE